jgi:2-oxoisovalerate dehydrogenase E1 component beta subunit
MESAMANLPKFEIPLGKAKILNEGNQLTVIGYGRLIHVCNTVAKRLREKLGYEIEVIDLRTLMPYDKEAISASIKKTGRVLVVNEDTEVTNFGEHLIRKIIDDHFYELQTPPKLLAGANTPGIGLAPPLEEAQVPQEHDIEQAMIDLVEAKA